MQRMVAAGFLVAGVFVLLGVGWALLAAGAVLWFRDDRAAGWLRERAQKIRPTLRTAASMPRHTVAGTSMGLGLVAAPAGIMALTSVAVGVVVAGVLLIAYAVFSGWGV